MISYEQLRPKNQQKEKDAAKQYKKMTKGVNKHMLKRENKACEAW